jgi:myo-inositol-1(or 4)-monophosphatase
MENFSWLSAFKEMGAKVRAEMEELFKGSGGGKALGRGAGGDTTLVLDKKAEDALLSVLEKLNSSGEQFTFVSEELGERAFGESDVLILADPIDGSNNAKYGLPFYSTALAMAKGRKLSDVSLGYIINLGNGDEFWAIKGQGAYKNGIRIKTSDRTELGMLNFEGSRPSRDIPAAMPLLTAARKVRCLGTTALDLACLASGATDAVLVPSPSRSFDYAAGWLLVHEAGGMVTDIAGNTLEDSPLGLGRTSPFLGAANRALLDRALSALKGGS